jgi:protein-S-isoprenylcysteine O-methyltransferase Ste14
MSEQIHGPDWKKHLLLRTLTRFIGGALILGVALFLAAGTARYWQAWVYMGLLFSCMSLALIYLYRKDPELLERRIRAREKERVQKLIQVLYTPIALGLWFLPGFDVRWHWSSVPVPAVLAADAIVLASYVLFLRVIRVNSFAARTVAVERGHSLVTTGPYAVVRHPMYTAIIGIYAATPPALGSFWAMLAALPLPLILALRIRNEEAVLTRDLPGYEAYARVTKYRLVPYIW